MQRILKVAANKRNGDKIRIQLIKQINLVCKEQRFYYCRFTQSLGHSFVRFSFSGSVFTLILLVTREFVTPLTQNMTSEKLLLECKG